MSAIANPIDALIDLQHAINSGIPLGFYELDAEYKARHDVFTAGERYFFAKIVNGEAQAVSIFGLVEPIEGTECWAVGCAVSESRRRSGLAAEAVATGLRELKKKLSQAGKKKFYVEAVIDVVNAPSISFAEKLYSGPAVKIIDEESGKPALWFKRLISIDELLA